jgi:hypothetical protein
MKIKSVGIIATLCACLSTQSASAVTIGTGPANTSISGFGGAGTTFGELFSAPITGTLSSFTLDLTSSNGNLMGGIGVWNGSGVSNILYTSPVTASALINTFATNISVVAGTGYVAFLSVDGVSGVSGTTSMPAISPAGSAFLNGFVWNDGRDGSRTYASSTWSGLIFQDNDVLFSATFNEPVSATPIPAALPLFASGLGGLGLFRWLKKRTARAV